MNKKLSWVIDAEKATGLKWDQLSLFDKIQWQKTSPNGRYLLSTPIRVLAYGRERFGDRTSNKK
jgi:hypothetical protein